MGNSGRDSDQADPLRSLLQAVTGGSLQVLRRSVCGGVSQRPFAPAGGARGSGGRHGGPLDLTARCERCGTPLPAGSFAHRMYCSVKCKNDDHYKLEAEARRARRAGRPCGYCQELLPDEAPFNRGYCNAKCRNAMRAVRRARAKEGRRCVQCGGEIPVKMISQAIYCGRTCQNHAGHLRRKQRSRPCLTAARFDALWQVTTRSTVCRWQ